MAERRKRYQNFSIKERDKLVKLIMMHRDILHKQDLIANDAKNKVWNKITNSFNSTSIIKRTKDSLMDVWEKMKDQGKICLNARNSCEARNVLSSVRVDPVMEQVIAILDQDNADMQVSDSQGQDNSVVLKPIVLDDPLKSEEVEIDVCNPTNTISQKDEKDFCIENNLKDSSDMSNEANNFNTPRWSTKSSSLPHPTEIQQETLSTFQDVNKAKYLDAEGEEGMEEGQEEWLSEGVLTDDDYVQTAEHDQSDSNPNTSQETQDQTIQTLQESDAIVQTTAVLLMEKVEVKEGNTTQNIEEQLNDLETTKNELPDDLDAFLIRKTDGKVVEAKVKEEMAVSKLKTEDDGNDTDDLLRMLGDGDQKVKKKALKMIKKNENIKDEGSSDDDDFIYERSQVKTLKLAKNALIKRPATKAEPENMSDGDDDETDQSSDEGSTVQRMFEVKKAPSMPVKKEPPKKIVKHVVQVNTNFKKLQKPDQKTNKQFNPPKPVLKQVPKSQVPKTVIQKTQVKPVEVKTPAPFKPALKEKESKSEAKESTFKNEDFDEIIDEEEFLEEDDIDLDEEEFGEESEGELSSKKQRIMRPEMMDEEVPSDAESHSEDGSLYDELPSSDSEDLDDWFTLDIRAERAGDYLPLLGSKARDLLLAERRRVSARVATLRQSLSALTDSARRQADQLRSAAMSLAEIDDTLRAA